MNARRMVPWILLFPALALAGTCEMMPPPEARRINEERTASVSSTCPGQIATCGASDSGAQGVAAVVVSDFNNDQRAEFAVAYQASRDIVVFSTVISSCDATQCEFGFDFTPRVRDPIVSARPLNLLAADLTGDGLDDLAFLDGSAFDGTVTVLENAGPTGFEVLDSIDVGAPFSGITTGDFDIDGAADIALVQLKLDSTTNLFQLSILIRLYDGATGRFDRQILFPMTLPLGTYISPYSSASIVAADLLGDTSDDLAVTITNPVLGKPGTTVVLENIGNLPNAVAPLAQAAPITVQPPSITLAADFDNDQVCDLAVVGPTGVQLLLNQADGTFDDGASLFPGSFVAAVAADLDGDSDADIAAVNELLGRVMILINDGDGVFTTSESDDVTIEGRPQSIDVGDINGDGRLDLVVTSLEANQVYYVLR